MPNGPSTAADTPAPSPAGCDIPHRQKSPSPQKPKRVITPIDPQVMSMIFQGLRDSLSSKRIANVPNQFSTFYFGNLKKARLAFWRAGIHTPQFFHNNSSWFNEMVVAKQILRLDQLRRMATPRGDAATCRRANTVKTEDAYPKHVARWTLQVI